MTDGCGRVLTDLRERIVAAYEGRNVSCHTVSTRFGAVGCSVVIAG